MSYITDIDDLKLGFAYRHPGRGFDIEIKSIQFDDHMPLDGPLPSTKFRSGYWVYFSYEATHCASGEVRKFHNGDPFEWNGEYKFMAICEKHTFGDHPDDAYLHALKGFENAEPVWPDRLTPLVKSMIDAFGVTPDPDAEFWGLSEEETFLLSPDDGRLALLGRTVAGHPYVVEKT